MRDFRTFGPAATVTANRVVEKTLPIASYADRNGYRPEFIGVEPALPLPIPGGRLAGDVATLVPEAQRTGENKHELKYRNFSVYMSVSRRLPILSAVNIDGDRTRRGVERTDIWRKDPRISLDYQILKGVYGEESKGLFSRGHMTRREDPNWGEDEALLAQADADTFHATNAAPQRQRFNGGVWLDLENYVLSNADRDNMRISVITGPVLAPDDPIYYGVRTPVAFWKVIAFRHEKSGRLTAIGYRKSQASELPSRVSPRFVFSEFKEMQVSIASLGAEADLDFGPLVELDVLAEAREMALEVQSVSDLYLST